MFNLAHTTNTGVEGHGPGMGAALDATRDWTLHLPAPVDRRHLLADPTRGIRCQLCLEEAKHQLGANATELAISIRYQSVSTSKNPPCVADSGRAEPGLGLAATASGRPGGVGSLDVSRPLSGPPALHGGP